MSPRQSLAAIVRRGLRNPVVGPASEEGRTGSLKSLRLFFVIITALVALGSCTWTMRQAREASIATALANRTRPVALINQGNAHLTLHDCRRLALENSLDLQVAAWEEGVRGPMAESFRARMLPRVEARYDLGQRENLPYSRSDVIGQEGLYEALGPQPGTGVTNFSTGRERHARRFQVELKWSPMDSAIAYYLSCMKDNEAAVAKYQRVRVAQQLMATVTEAFYRLLALTEALPKASLLATSRSQIERDLRALHKRQLVTSEEYYQSRTQSAQASGQLRQLYLEMGKQKELLSAAMNASPDSPICVRGELYPLPDNCLDPPGMETAALRNRPELFQADLNLVNSVSDTKRIIVKYFPRVEGYLGYYRDENKYLLDREYKEGGGRMVWDLMELTANLMEHDSAKAKVNKTEREQALISLGIMSQVRLKTLEAMSAFERHRTLAAVEDEAREKFRVAGEVSEVKERLAPEKIERIARQKAYCDWLQAQVDRLKAAGEVHAAVAAAESATGSNYPVSMVK